jgi:hypothetical protein
MCKVTLEKPKEIPVSSKHKREFSIDTTSNFHLLQEEAD